MPISRSDIIRDLEFVTPNIVNYCYSAGRPLTHVSHDLNLKSDFKNKRFPVPKKVRKIGGQRAGYNGNSGPTPAARGSMNNTATRHNTLQCTATHETCAVADGVMADTTAATHCTTLRHTTTHCNTLQRSATYCKIRRHALHVCAATRCSTPRHTAAHCDVTRKRCMCAWCCV